MFEKFLKKTIDEQIASRVINRHSAYLKNIAEKLKNKYTPEKLQDLYSDREQAEIDNFASENEQKISDDLEIVLSKLKELPSSKIPGHEYAHIIDNLNSSLRIFDEYNDLSKGEKLEIILADLVHDLGRFKEEEIKNIDAKDMSVILPMFVGKKLQKETSKLPDNLNLRILHDIYSGSVPKTGFRTADIVHQSDREQLTGPATILRGLSYDVAIGKRDMMIKEKDGADKKLPLPNAKDDDNWLLQYEFYMRNLFPPVSPDGVQTANRDKQENATILMLGVEGKDKKLYEQIFGPELGLVKPEEAHWSKKPIPAEVFETAKSQKDEFLQFISERKLEYKYDVDGLLDLTEKALETESVEKPEQFRDVIKEKLTQCSELERKNYWLIMIYTLRQRQARRLEDIKFLGNLKDDSPIVTVARQPVLKELVAREDNYQKLFPEISQ